MAKNFGKANNSKIEAIAKKSNEQANLISIKYIEDEKLVDYPLNNEDVSYTEDIELSIKEQGFTDPIEITDFNMEDDTYMIISGHRRRMAGRKQNIKAFPCIIRHFNNENAMRNYVLMANSHRDSAKDPLLLPKRYLGHEEYLKSINFKGSKREEIARRMGLKVAQADRYNQLNKVIVPFWDMIAEEIIGISNVTDSGLYTHSVEEQEEILIIFKEAVAKDVKLTREVCKNIVVGYRNGKRTWAEIEADNTPKANPIMTNFPSTDVSDNSNDNASNDVDPLSRNNEVNYDTSHREDLPSGTDPYKEERLDQDDYDVINNSNKDNEEKENEKEQKPKDIAQGEKIIKTLSNLEGALNEVFRFESIEQNKTAIKTFGSMSELLLDNIENILGEVGNNEELEKACLSCFNSIEKDIKRIKERIGK